MLKKEKLMDFQNQLKMDKMKRDKDFSVVCLEVQMMHHKVKHQHKNEQETKQFLMLLK